MSRLSIVVAAALSTCVIASLPTPAQARDQIRIVGSSTVYPFASSVVEHFAHASGSRGPVLESTGSGAGIKLFCEGIGEQTPDIVNASRRILPMEVATCAKNGATAAEIIIGYDGIVFASAGDNQPAVTREQLWRALAKTVPINGVLVPNPYKSWSDVSSALPPVPIKVYGPAPNHGTRDAVVELVLDVGCEQAAEVKALPKDQQAVVCRTIREDGAWVDVSDDYNLTVARLRSQKGAVGIIGFSYFDASGRDLKGFSVEGVGPTFEAIADRSYPLSRPLYFYVKREHLDKIPGLRDYVADFVSSRAIGPDGYLIDKGLIPLPAAELKKTQAIGKTLEPLHLD